MQIAACHDQRGPVEMLPARLRAAPARKNYAESHVEKLFMFSDICRLESSNHAINKWNHMDLWPFIEPYGNGWICSISERFWYPFTNPYMFYQFRSYSYIILRFVYKYLVDCGECMISFGKTENTWRRDGGVCVARNGPDTTCILRDRNAKRKQCRK